MGLQGTRDPTQNNQDQDRRRHGHSQRQDRHFRAGQGRAQGHPAMRHQPASRQSKTVLGWAALPFPALPWAELSWTELDCHLTMLALFARISTIRTPYSKQILLDSLSIHPCSPASTRHQPPHHTESLLAAQAGLLKAASQENHANTIRYDTTQESRLLGDLG
jgi:hypothetical protein